MRLRLMILPSLLACFFILFITGENAALAQANLPPPTLTSPPNGGGNQSPTPTLIWNGVSGASSYRVMVATSQSALPRNPDADSCSGCTINDTTSATFYIPSAPLSAG